jgi:hypothetical protein
MKFLFDDETFSFETLRSTGFASYFGADLGEVLATALAGRTAIKPLSPRRCAPRMDLSSAVLGIKEGGSSWASTT